MSETKKTGRRKGVTKLDETFARPIDFKAGAGVGKDRALVLGGGGLFFVAWQAAYLHGLQERGVNLSGADIVVGTSAGSVIASLLTFGGLKRFSRQVDLMSRMPALIALMAPAGNYAASQERALFMFRDADNARPETIREIGHAALAADTPQRPRDTRRSVGFAVGHTKWPSPSLHLTMVDCYTGERLVASEATGCSVIRAAAASSAVPGIFPPQFINDRRCMDGGVSGSGTHCDIVAGAKKALVISLTATMSGEVGQMTISPDNLETEMRELAAAGTKAFVRGPSKVDMTALMSPDAAADGLVLGEEQAASDAAEMAAFWNS